MNILVSNDDGIHAEGLEILRSSLERLGHNVYTVAPQTNQSATSHSLTLTEPLRIYRRSKRIWEITGTPTDCVLIATHGLIDVKMDAVISGINHGPNMGEDVLYSGTVAAAMEGVMMGIPSMAISMASYGKQDFSSAFPVVEKLLYILKRCRSRKVLLNANIPPVKTDRMKGVKITALGNRIYSDHLIEKKDPRGRKYYWIGGSQPKFRNTKGTDFEAITKNYISVTPINMDLTDYAMMKTLKERGKDVL